MKRTYQHMMSQVFEPLLGKTMTIYIDDILVKSKAQRDHLNHLKEAFTLLRQHWLRLNFDKCAFGVGSGNFLGFLVKQRGIEMALGQIRAIFQMKPPTTKKEIQSLNELAALNRFILRYSDHLQPFFKELKVTNAKGWGVECNEAFRTIKEYIASPLSLS